LKGCFEILKDQLGNWGWHREEGGGHLHQTGGS
jgi:hypothetical protein